MRVRWQLCIDRCDRDCQTDRALGYARIDLGPIESR